MPGLVDAHLHFFSRPFFDALARLSPLPGTPDERLSRAAAEARIEIPSADVGVHAARWLAELDRHDVARAACFASLPEEIPAVAEACALARGRLVPFALVNPKAEGTVERARSLVAESRFRGVLLFPAMHHYRLDGPEATPLYEALAPSRAIVIAHCGMLQVTLRDKLGIPRPYDLSFANPLSLVPAANRFRQLTFVVPHFGAGFFRDTLMLGAQCDNVCVDSSSSNAWMATQERPTALADVFARALRVFGPERVLFGTDSSTFPRGWRADLLAEQERALADCGVNGQAREQILGGNAARLFDRAG
jgi:hypothetical protein